MRFKDLTGMRFTRLEVIKRIKNDKHNRVCWLCKCDCGNETIVASNDLKSQNTQSCGCYRSKMSRKRCRETRTTHGLSYFPIHYVWRAMKDRCYNKNNTNYKDYGERGIRVCNDWLMFEGFHLWVTEQGIDENCCDKNGNHLTIERNNVNEHYDPSNCTWTPMSEQAWNKRNTIMIDGMTVRDYAKLHNLKPDTVRYVYYRDSQGGY